MFWGWVGGSVIFTKVPPVMCGTIQVEGESSEGVAQERQRHHAAWLARHLSLGPSRCLSSVPLPASLLFFPAFVCLSDRHRNSPSTCTMRLNRLWFRSVEHAKFRRCGSAHHMEWVDREQVHIIMRRCLVSLPAAGRQAELTWWRRIVLLCGQDSVHKENY